MGACYNTIGMKTIYYGTEELLGLVCFVIAYISWLLGADMKVEPLNGLFRAVASLSLPGGQDRMVSSIFPHFPVASLIFPQFFFIFFLILVFRVGGSPTREGPGYATGAISDKVFASL